MTKFLVQSAANVKYKFADGLAARDFASMSSHQDVVAYLKSIGAP